MKSNKSKKYAKIFQKHSILRRREAIKLGVPEYIIYEMTKNGELIQEARGLYRLASSEPLSDQITKMKSLKNNHYGNKTGHKGKKNKNRDRIN